MIAIGPDDALYVVDLNFDSACSPDGYYDVILQVRDGIMRRVAGSCPGYSQSDGLPPLSYASAISMNSEGSLAVLMLNPVSNGPNGIAKLSPPAAPLPDRGNLLVPSSRTNELYEMDDGRSVDYLVDAQNRRVAKKVNGTFVKKWIYENQLKPVAEFDGSGALSARYLHGVTVKGSTSYRVVADDLGTPRLLVNSTTGAVAQRLDVDEWGQVGGDSSAGFHVFGFAGGIYDPDTGLVRFGVRDYDPLVGRWTAKDPVLFGGGQANLLGYSLGKAAQQAGEAIGDFLSNYEDMMRANGKLSGDEQRCGRIRRRRPHERSARGE